MSLYEVFAVVACAGHLGLALAAALRSSRRPLAPLLAAFCLVMFGWNVSVLLWLRSRSIEWFYLDVGVAPLTAPVLLHFVLVFTGLRRRLRALLWAAYLGFGALGLLAAAAFFGEWGPAFLRSRLWSILYLSGALPLLGLALAVLFRHLRRQTNPAETVRTRLVLAAFAIGGVLATTELWAGAGVHVPRLGPPGTLLIAGLLCVVALRYELFESNALALAAVDGLAVACVTLLTYFAMFRSLAASTAGLVASSLALVALLGVVTWRAATTAVARRARMERLALLGQFSAHLAHDLKNPLASLKGAVQFLQEERAQGRSIDGQKEFLRLLAAEADRLSRLVDKYRRLGSLEPAREETCVNGLVRDTLARGQLAAPEVALEAELAPGLPPVSVDPDLLSVALENVVRNAVEAVRGPGRVLVRTEVSGSSDPPSGVCITVTDDGVGMDARQKERAFDEFFTTKAQGSGLGLSLVRRVVEAHGGRVSLSSRQGMGTQVRLRLPVS